MLISRSRKLNRARMITLLGNLSNAVRPATTLYLPAGLAESDIEQTISSIALPDEIRGEIVKTAARSKTGSTLFWGDSGQYLILPPFPVTETLIFDNCHVDPLLHQLQKDFVIAIVLVRLGESAVGIFEGEKRLSSKVGKGLVHGKHSKGGSSSQRFERHREKQMEMFFTRVCDHAREHLEPYVKQMDYVVYGGERKTLQNFRKQCKFLKAFETRVLPQLLDVRKPRQTALEEAITEVWSSRVIEWVEG